MRIQGTLPMISRAHYKLDEYTTEYGALIFDDSRSGAIHNTFMYTILWTNQLNQNGHLDFYIDKDSGRFKSIWFVLLSGFEISYKEKFESWTNAILVEPIVDIKFLWEDMPNVNSDGSWKRLKRLFPVKIYHNKRDVVQFKFGDCFQQIVLNEKVSMFLDKESNLSSIVIRDFEEVNKLLERLVHK